MQVSPVARGMLASHSLSKASPGRLTPSPGPSAAGSGINLPITAVITMAKDMAALNIIDSFLNAQQVITIRPLNIYQRGANNMGIQRVVQGQTAALMLQLMG